MPTLGLGSAVFYSCALCMIVSHAKQLKALTTHLTSITWHISGYSVGNNAGVTLGVWSNCEKRAIILLANGNNAYQEKKGSSYK